LEAITLFEFKQLDLAYLYGGEVGVHYHPHRMHRLHLESNFSITIGQDSEGNALNLMPQPNTNNRIRFDIANKQKFQVKSVLLEHQYFLPQNRVGMNELPSGEYHLINLAFDMGIRDNEQFSFKAGVRNLTNSSYIAHLSPFRNLGIPQPGINFFLSVKYNFSNQYKNK
jgi:iron complex outermembrane recepter protein